MSPSLVLALIAQYRYLFIFLGAPFIGPIVSLGSGVLVRFGTLDFWAVAATLMASELCADVAWYWLGYHYGRPVALRFGRVFGITEEHLKLVQHLYHRYHNSIILISKLTAGFGIAPAVFVTAGFSRVPFRRYMAMNTLGQIIWTPIMLAIGYYLGHFYLQTNSVLEKSAFAGTTLLLLFGLFGIGRALWNRMVRSTS